MECETTIGDRKATPKQIKAIVTGLVDRPGTFLVAEEIIARYFAKTEGAPKVRKPRQHKKHLAPHVDYWEDAFPGKGRAVAEFFNRLHGWNPELTMTGVGSDLGAVNVFGGGFRHVSFSSLTSMARNLLRRDLAYSLIEQYEPHVGANLRYRMATDQTLLLHVRDSHGMQALESRLASTVAKGTAVVRSAVLDGFRQTVYYACAAIVMDDVELGRQMRLFLASWRRGHFPIGIDHEGMLVFLTA